ncbi:hypothetical protein [Gracilimonas amylolytica]|uniref:hypothetical protein n=1 Tax=Gracilimonas amylolytica TaxID=1749045 RepID=UPI000CD9D4C4|nr:hypothetical protein [Gracilimonas amylolytica]
MDIGRLLVYPRSGAEHRDEEKIFSLHYKESQFGLSVHRSIVVLFIMIMICESPNNRPVMDEQVEDGKGIERG